jgi:glutathione synthase/RimK-type ligase-like ATP-grasp enzyme
MAVQTMASWLELKHFRACREAFIEAGIPYDEANPSAILVWHDAIRDLYYWSDLLPWQIVNRIPSMNVICRKYPFARLTERIRPAFPQTLSSFPRSFLLPTQNAAFTKELEATEKTYIVKPDSGSMGQGIQIIQPGETYTPTDELAVAQEYIESYLMEGRKFDLRVYVLVGSVDPLTIYVFRDGLARFCSEEYSKDSMFAKVSNVSFNRDNPEMEIRNISLLISEVFPQMALFGVDIAALWRRIDRVIILSIMVGHGCLIKGEEWNCRPIGYSRCFQLLGFDILLDKYMQPHVLEVNYRPNFDYYRGKERRMKVEMIRDAILIGAPFAKAQVAVMARRGVPSKKSWASFLDANPEILKSGEQVKAEVLARSRYVQVWPALNDDIAKGYGRLLERIDTLPLEAIPGFKIPDHLWSTFVQKGSSEQKDASEARTDSGGTDAPEQKGAGDVAAKDAAAPKDEGDAKTDSEAKDQTDKLEAAPP